MIKKRFPLARTIAAAVTSGIAAKLGGGKFVNGAVSTAFTNLLNEEGRINNS